VERRRQWLLSLLIVLGAHLALVWPLLSSHLLSVKTRSGSLQLVWIPPPTLKTAPQRGTTTQSPSTGAPRHRNDRIPALPSIAAPSDEENNAIHPTPDWNAELKQAAKNALVNELDKRKHDTDFGHVFSTQPKMPEQFAWDYAATHRVEALPQGGVLIHINDNCVLLIFPLPLIGCGIGKRPANGDLFNHMREK
jgi:hypothetical protein